MNHILNQLRLYVIIMIGGIALIYLILYLKSKGDSY